MTLVQTLFDWWRARLERLNSRLAQNPYDSFRLVLERRVLRFLLWRHADAPHASPPREAVPLSSEDHVRSQTLYLHPELQGPSRQASPELEREDAPSALIASDRIDDATWFRAIVNSGIEADIPLVYVDIEERPRLSTGEFLVVAIVAIALLAGLLRLALIIVSAL